MDLTRKVFDAGVVGAGGAGFPTHVKLEGSADTVIANGVECEPLLWSDKVSMIHFATEIIKGIALVMQQTGAKKALILNGVHRKPCFIGAIEGERIHAHLCFQSGQANHHRGRG